MLRDGNGDTALALDTTDTLVAQKSPLASSDRVIDARPFIPRVSDGLFRRAELIRDQLHAMAKAALKRRGIEANALKSGLHEFPTWISIELWLPQRGDPKLTARALATISVNILPYHRFEFVYTIRFDVRGKKKTVGEIYELGASEIDEVIEYLVDNRPRPKFSHICLRKHDWQIWKPKNKPDAIAIDWQVIGAWALGIVGLVTISFVVGIFLLIGAIVWGVLLSHRKVLVRTSGRPLDEPRYLRAVDSWQAIVFGLGADVQMVRDRLIERFNTHSLGPGFKWSQERIWHWGLDAIVEREQIVLRLRRAILFFHVEQYQEDLFVAWDGHINRGQWTEKKVLRGIDKEIHQLAQINVATAATQTITEYDVDDSNCLIEWAHAQAVQVVRKIMSERKIEQEIDFKIIRGEREGLTATEDEKTGKGMRKLFKRTA